MIKVEKNNVNIEVRGGVPTMLTELTTILRGVREAITDEGFKPEKADEMIDECVVLSRMSSEELKEVADEKRREMFALLFGGGLW